jgi:DnaJ-class molecular chaperone
VEIGVATGERNVARVGITDKLDAAGPKWSNTGTVLRLRGKGVPRLDRTRGDESVTLKLKLPEKPDPELEKFVANWRSAYSPRETMEA